MSQHLQTTTDVATESTDSTTCPECNGSVTTNDSESVCEDCGLVLDEDIIDHGPEWRAFNASDRSEKSRVGAPTTNTMHDKGLSTNIDWRNKDAYGNNISQRKRKKMSRLRTWQQRARTENGRERGLQFSLGEISRMASALGLPKSAREIAAVIIRDAQDNDLVMGRSYEAVTSGALYAAARINELPRTLDEVATVSRVERLPIQRAYAELNRELSLGIPTANPQDYLPRVSSELDLTNETERWARTFLNTIEDHPLTIAKTATGLVAAAVYCATFQTDQRIVQTEIADTAGTSVVTIRNRYTEVFEAYKDEADDDINTDKYWQGQNAS